MRGVPALQVPRWRLGVRTCGCLDLEEFLPFSVKGIMAAAEPDVKVVCPDGTRLSVELAPPSTEKK